MSRHYSRLMLRQLFYVIVSAFGYPSSARFYKKVGYHVCKMRRVNIAFHMKFVDYTRPFISAVLAFPKVELWVESDSLRNFLENLAMRYRVSVQVVRGFGSLSMYRKCLERAARKGLERILYVGDWDPSGLIIDQIVEKEMNVKVTRLVLTREQISKLRLPSLPVNVKDSRAKAYIAKYGDRIWEVEAVRPRTLLKLVESGLREYVPQEHLVEADSRERASRVARPVTERLRRAVETEVYSLLKAGMSDEEILSQVASEYGLRNKRRNSLDKV